VAAFVRIGWPPSIGIGGRLPSESVAALPRIPQASDDDRDKVFGRGRFDRFSHARTF
jgi:hypothetical protein